MKLNVRGTLAWLLTGLFLTVAGCGSTGEGGLPAPGPEEAAPAASAPSLGADAGPASGEMTEPAPAPDPTPGPEPTLAPEPAPVRTRTVLLIPGTTITGDYFDTMAERLQAAGFNPVIYEPSDLLTDGLALGAQRIGEVIDQVLADRGEQKLHVVAECNGGVATRYYLQVLGGHARVDQVVTFVSAHHGTWESPVGAWITGWQSLDDVTPGSAFMQTLDAAPFPDGLKLTSIYTCRDEFMVPYTTSVVEGATNVLFCDHTLYHFDGFWDPLVFERIQASLDGTGAAASSSY